MAKTKTPETKYHETVSDRTVTDFLNSEYKDFAQYVITTRACPSLIDGFKTGARKIIHAAFTATLKDKKKHKMLELVGDTYTKTMYAHGNASLEGTIMTLGASFLDNFNPIDIIGQGGTLREPNSYASPRYLFVSQSKYLELIYGVDYDILEYVFDEGMYLEPVNYLPIIPTVLTSRSEGLAPGYRFKSYSYNPIDIIDMCINHVNGEDKHDLLRPYIRGIDPKKFFYDNEEKCWSNKGTWVTNGDMLLITDLPFDVHTSKYEKLLDKLVETGFIKDWRNFGKDGSIDYRVIFEKGVLNKISDKQLISKFKLVSKLTGEQLQVVDEKGKIRHFETPELLLEYFVKYRLNKYNDRKTKLITIKEQQLKENTALCKFIDLVTSNKLKINNRPIGDIKLDMDKYELSHELLKIQVSKLTKEEKEEIMKRNKELEEELLYIKNTSIEAMYIDDLKKLKKEIEKEFK